MKIHILHAGKVQVYKGNRSGTRTRCTSLASGRRKRTR